MIQADSHSTFTLALQIWAGLGPLVGGCITLYLTRSWQHKQWLLDCRKQEFRELISAISASHVEYSSSYALRDAQGQAFSCSFLEAYKRALQTVVDRIYIAEDVKRLDVRNRFGRLRGTERDKYDSTSEETLNLIAELSEVARRG